MPVQLPLNFIRKPLPLESLAHNSCRFIGLSLGIGESINQLLNTMTINLQGVETEGLEPMRIDGGVVAVHRLLGLPQGVYVDKHNQVVQLVVA